MKILPVLALCAALALSCVLFALVHHREGKLESRWHDSELVYQKAINAYEADFERNSAAFAAYETSVAGYDQAVREFDRVVAGRLNEQVSQQFLELFPQSHDTPN